MHSWCCSLCSACEPPTAFIRRSLRMYLAQVDLDLGNYERFLDITLTRDNNLTTGKVYQVARPSQYLSHLC